MNNKRNMKIINYKEKLSNSTIALIPRQRRQFWWAVVVYSTKYVLMCNRFENQFHHLKVKVVSPPRVVSVWKGVVLGILVGILLVDGILVIPIVIFVVDEIW